MRQAATRTKGKARKARKIKNLARPVIEPGKLYNRREAALACGVSQITMFRAYDSGNLKAYRAGARLQHSGQHLLDWLEAGGKTGRTREDVERERSEK